MRDRMAGLHGGATGVIDHQFRPLTGQNLPLNQFRQMDKHPRRLAGIYHTGKAGGGAQRAGIAYLPAGFCVKRSLV